MGVPPTIHTTANSEVTPSLKPSVPALADAAHPCLGKSDTDLYSEEFLSLLRVLGPKQSGKWTENGGVSSVDCEETESHVQSCISSANIREPALHQFPSGLRASGSPLQGWGPSPHTLVQLVQCVGFSVCRARPPRAAG